LAALIRKGSIKNPYKAEIIALPTLKSFPITSSIQSSRAPIEKKKILILPVLVL